MAKILNLILILISINVQSNAIKGSFSQAPDDIIHAMEQFNPATVLKDFSAHPPESELSVAVRESDVALKALGKERAAQDETASMVLEQEQSRPKIKLNPKAAEIEYAERLIDNAESILHPVCFKKPVPCVDHVETKTCDETSQYVAKTCEGATLNVHPHVTHHAKVGRGLYLDATHQEGQIDLTVCSPNEETGLFKCGPDSLIKLHPRCEHIEVHATQLPKGMVNITQQPTCASPVISLNYGGKVGLAVQLDVTEYWSDEDTWTKQDCSKEALEREFEFCAYESTTTCTEPNATKIINGVPITRTCWGEASHYQCLSDKASTCAPLMEQGCSHVSSQCVSQTEPHCDHVVQTYQCGTQECFPDKEICPSEVACADGQCDVTKDEKSDDINEGLSRLGTLAGTADEVATNQVDVGQAAIFRGAVQQCEKYPLGIRDCCTDEGLLDAFIHCPKELKDLQRAKSEHRVVYLGRYTDDLLDTWHYVHCVFPSKLAGIIQLQGRGAQLGIPFGAAKTPNCRGITPEELERIDFSRLDISELVAEITGRKNFPASDLTDGSNADHVSRLEKEGIPYD